MSPSTRRIDPVTFDPDWRKYNFQERTTRASLVLLLSGPTSFISQSPLTFGEVETFLTLAESAARVA